MRILIRKNKLKYILKHGIFYVIVCYLLASWGVNGVINPMHYFREAVMYKEEIFPTEDEKYLMIDLADKYESREYLSFLVSESDNIFFDIVLIASVEEPQKVIVEVHQGINTLKIPEGAGSIRVLRDTITQNGAVLNSYMLSEYRNVDSMKMMEIMISMLLLFGFWEAVQYIRKRYTK